MADTPSQPPGWPYNQGPEQDAAPPPVPPGPRFEPAPPSTAFEPAAPATPPPPPGYAYEPPYEPPVSAMPPPPPGYAPAAPVAAPDQPPPPPPGWNQSQVPAKKSSRTLWITLLAIFAVLALGVGACTVWFVGAVKAPVDKSNEFLALIDEGDYAGAVELTDPVCSRGLTAQDLEDFFQFANISYDLKSSEVVNSSATVSGSFSSGVASFRQITLTLRKSDGVWRVCGLNPR